MDPIRVWSPLHQPIYFDHVTWLALAIVLVVSLIIIIKIGDRR